MPIPSRHLARPSRRALLTVAGGAALSVASTGWAAPAGNIVASDDPNWTVFSRVKVKTDYDKGVFTAAFPPDILAMRGKPLSISGYVLPIDVADLNNEADHFILSKYSPFCPFCPPGKPNEHMEIDMVRPIVLTPNLLKLTGVLELQNDGVQGLFLGLRNARAVR